MAELHGFRSAEDIDRVCRATRSVETQQGYALRPRRAKEVAGLATIFWARILNYDEDDHGKHAWIEQQWDETLGTWADKQDGRSGQLADNPAHEANGFSAMPNTIVQMKTTQGSNGTGIYIFEDAQAFTATVTTCNKETGEGTVTPDALTETEEHPPDLDVWMGQYGWHQEGDTVYVVPAGAGSDYRYVVLDKIPGYEAEEPDEPEGGIEESTENELAPVQDAPDDRDYCTDT